MRIERRTYQLLYLMTALQPDPRSRFGKRNLGPAERRAAHLSLYEPCVLYIGRA